MKDAHSPQKISLIKNALFGIVGMVIICSLLLLEIVIPSVIAYALQMDDVVAYIILGLSIALVLLYAWLSLNVALGIGLGLVLQTKPLGRTLTFIKRLPFKVDRWLLRPYVAIVQWVINLHHTPTTK